VGPNLGIRSRLENPPAGHSVTQSPAGLSGYRAGWSLKIGEVGLPVVVDVFARFVMNGGAAFDMFGNMQSPVIHTEEQS
jgi:hypothetical protein